MSAPVRPFPLYSDRASVESVLSEAAVRLRLDFDDDGMADTAESGTPLANVLQSASDTIDYYCWSMYDPNLLANSSLVWRWATVLAAYELDRLRNNPPSESLADWAAEVQDKLAEVRDKGRVIPGVALRLSRAPTWANVRVVQAYQFKVIRVEKGRSSPSQLPQLTDYQELYQGQAELG